PQAESLNLLPSHLLRSPVCRIIKDGPHLQARAGSRPPDVPEHDPKGPKRFPGPIDADVAEQAVFDGVPFRAARRVMTDGAGQLEPVTQPGLKVHLPAP